jgi:hypothetical protein
VIDEGLHITRGVQGWLYNPLEESGHDDETPTGTLWNTDGWDDFSNITTRTYLPLREAIGSNFSNIAGTETVMHDTINDKYYAIKFLSWTQGQNGGGFSYLRYSIDMNKLQEGVKFADGSVLKSATGLGRVKSTAPNDRRIEEAVGYAQVSVSERTLSTFITATSRAEVNSNLLWVDSSISVLDDIFDNPSVYGVLNVFEDVEFSLDQNTWYKWTGSTNFSGDERGYSISGAALTYEQGDTIFVRYTGGGAPQVWWDKANLPSGSSDFRGAVIDYHAYTGESTIIGTIHIVDDDGEENITHTEVASGSTDGENDDLWLVQNEGTISYRRIDGESKTLKIHWSAKVFYGAETYD